jgi:hydroxymethylpyrimidine/phosphomethylpyrimidine kinase
MDSNHIPVALTVAGSDCSGGAGIQADLKTFLNHRVQGLSAVTCIVAETPLEVRHIESTLEAQLNILSESYPISAAKTGLLPSQASIDRVAKVFSNREIPLVVDPVMIASTGSSLTEENTLHALTHQLLPVAALVTPNPNVTASHVL